MEESTFLENNLRKKLSFWYKYDPDFQEIKSGPVNEKDPNIELEAYLDELESARLCAEYVDPDDLKRYDQAARACP